MLPVPVWQHGAGPCSFQHTLRFRHGVTAHCSAKVSTPSARGAAVSVAHELGPARPSVILCNSDVFEDNAKGLLESAVAAQQPDFQN